MSDPLVTKNPANLCVGIAQHAQLIVSNMFSAYWSATETKPIPAVFIRQTFDSLRAIEDLIEQLRKYAK